MPVIILYFVLSCLHSVPHLITHWLWLTANSCCLLHNFSYYLVGHVPMKGRKYRHSTSFKHFLTNMVAAIMKAQRILGSVWVMIKSIENKIWHLTLNCTILIPGSVCPSMECVSLRISHQTPIIFGFWKFKSAPIELLCIYFHIL